jgi:hypothetical protein
MQLANNHYERGHQMKLGKILVILIMLTVSTSSFAASRRSTNKDTYDLRATSTFHLGVGLGMMKTDNTNASGTSIPFTIFAGTDINRFLSVDVAYTNLGSTDIGSGSTLKGAVYSLSVVGMIPVTNAVSMFAKFGFANSGMYVESPVSTSATYSTAAPTIGLGVQAGITKQTDIRIAYDNYKITADNSTTNNADITSVSMIFKF